MPKSCSSDLVLVIDDLPPGIFVEAGNHIKVISSLREFAVTSFSNAIIVTDIHCSDDPIRAEKVALQEAPISWDISSFVKDGPPKAIFIGRSGGVRASFSQIEGLLSRRPSPHLGSSKELRAAGWLLSLSFQGEELDAAMSCIAELYERDLIRLGGIRAGLRCLSTILYLMVRSTVSMFSVSKTKGV